MHPNLYLWVERVRARELWEEADRQRRARLVARASVISAIAERFGWVLVRTGLRLVDRHACGPQGSGLGSPQPDSRRIFRRGAAT